MKLVIDILRQMSGIPKSQEKFLAILFKTVFCMSGRINFLNMSRYSQYSEKTFRRHFGRKFDFLKFNAQAIAQVYNTSGDYILAADASFIPKSGNCTYGLGHFWNSIQSRYRKGLEISSFALVNVNAKVAYTLKVDQVPPAPKVDDESSIDFFLTQLKDLKAAELPFSLPQYLVVDGAYSKKKFIDGATSEGFDVISRLRKDANLRYLHQPSPNFVKGRGRPRKYDGKVDCKNPDFSKFEFVENLNEHISLYRATLYSISLKRNIQLLYLNRQNAAGKNTYVMLYCTDLKINPKTIYHYYAARFQIEFTYRDAKQYTGLTHCQARGQQQLHFHFNMSLTALNLARIQHTMDNPAQPRHPFSMASFKRRNANEMMLNLFLSKLDLDPNLQKIKMLYQKLRNFGTIAA